MKNVNKTSTVQGNIPSVHIKAKYREEIRRFSFTGNHFETLLDLLQEIFRIPVETTLVIKYRDDEEELVTISTSHEFDVAVSICSDLLHIFLFDASLSMDEKAPSILNIEGVPEVGVTEEEWESKREKERWRRRGRGRGRGRGRRGRGYGHGKGQKKKSFSFAAESEDLPDNRDQLEALLAETLDERNKIRSLVQESKKKISAIKQQLFSEIKANSPSKKENLAKLRSEIWDQKSEKKDYLLSMKKMNFKARCLKIKLRKVNHSPKEFRTDATQNYDSI